jgi:hypothetical protein
MRAFSRNSFLAGLKEPAVIGRDVKHLQQAGQVHLLKAVQLVARRLVVEPPEPARCQDRPLGGGVPQVDVNLKAGILHLEAALSLAALVQRDLPGLGIAHSHGAPVVVLAG